MGVRPKKSSKIQNLLIKIRDNCGTKNLGVGQIHGFVGEYEDF